MSARGARIWYYRILEFLWQALSRFYKVADFESPLDSVLGLLGIESRKLSHITARCR